MKTQYAKLMAEVIATVLCSHPSFTLIEISELYPSLQNPSPSRMYMTIKIG